MRPVLVTISIFAVVVGLAVIGLLPVGYQSHREAMRQEFDTAGRAVAAATPARPEPIERPQRNTRNHVISVKGEAKVDQLDAELDALVQAQIELEKYLRQLDPPVYWKPSVDYIRNGILKGKLPALIIEPVNTTLLVGNGDVEEITMKRLNLEIELTPALRRDLLYNARQDVSVQRMYFVGAILGVVVLLLIAGGGYIHFDERTKGYYTGWLKLAAAGAVVVLFGLGLWWFVRGPE
jgi:hypothetical protein